MDIYGFSIFPSGVARWAVRHVPPPPIRFRVPSGYSGLRGPAAPIGR